jgi:hypothetical protein
MIEETTTIRREPVEFSPRVFILQVRDSSRYILSRWPVLLLTGLLLGAALAIYTFNKKTKYEAEITFALDEGAGQAADANPLPELRERFGFGNTLEAGGIFSSLTNIVELIQSRLMIQQTLRKTVYVNGKDIVLGDFFLDSLNYRNKWLPGDKNKALLTRKNLSSEDSLQLNSIYGSMYNMIINAYLKIDRKGRGTSLISVICTTENELFTKLFLENLIDAVSRYYVDIKTKRAKINLDFIAQRTDSIRNAYAASTNSRASFSDANQNVVREVVTVNRERMQTNVDILKESYIELVRNLEAAKVRLVKDTPLFQMLDTPVLPLKKTTPAWFRNMLIGFVIGVLIGAIYVWLKYIIASVLERDSISVETMEP